jgi:hypothetical protein
MLDRKIDERINKNMKLSKMKNKNRKNIAIGFI